MTGWRGRLQAWAQGRTRARMDDRSAQQAALDRLVFEAIRNGELLKPLPKRGH